MLREDVELVKKIARDTAKEEIAVVLAMFKPIEETPVVEVVSSGKKEAVVSVAKKETVPTVEKKPTASKTKGK